MNFNSLLKLLITKVSIIRFGKILSMANNLVAFVLDSNSPSKEFSQVIGGFSKQKSSFKLALIGDNPSIVDSKGLQQIIQDNRALIFKNFSDFQNWSSNTTEFDSLYFASAKNIANLNAASELIENSSLNSFEAIKLIPEFTSKTKIPFINKLVNLTTQLFSGVQTSDHNNLFIGLSSEAFNSISSSTFFNRLKLDELLFMLEKAASCKGFEINEKAIGFSKIHKTENVLKSIVNTKTVGLKSRVTYMVGESLAEIKRNGIEWNNGNSGIYRLLFFALSLLMVVLLPIISLGFGMTWDEPDNVRYAEDILKYFFSFGEDKNVLDITNPKNRVYSHLVNYGLFFDSFSALVNKITPFGLYETRHMLNALSGFVGMFFVGLLARVAGNWRMGLIGLVIMLFSPYFFGHSMNNPKDIPFASGFIMSLYFIVKYLKQLPKPKTSTLLLLTLSIGLVNSIRIGGLLLVAFMGLFTGIMWLYQAKHKGLKTAVARILPYAKYVIGVATGSYLLGILPWPYALQAPFENPFLALQSFTKFSNVTIYEVFEGKRMFMNEVPWYYIPKLMIIGNPLYSIFGAALCLVPLFIKNGHQLKLPILWFAVFSLVFPIFYAVQGDSTLYNGWRHFLFVYPAMVVLAAAGWEYLLQIFKAKFVQIAVTLVFTGLVVNTAVWMVKYHPNEYVYFNEFVGGYSGAYGNYELDTYGNGIRQGFKTLVEEFPEVTEKKSLIAFNMTGWDWQHEDTKNYFDDSVRGTWVREYERLKKPFDYAVFFPRTYTKSELEKESYPPKGTVYIEEVEGKPLFAIVKRENDYMMNGHKFTAKSNFPAAIPEWLKAIEYDPLSEEAWRNLGMCYLNMGQNDQAKNALKKAIDIRPESHIAHGYLGVLNSRINNLEEARKEYLKAIELKHNYIFPYMQLANLYIQNGLYSDALKYYKKGQEKLGRNDANVLNQMGICYSKLGSLDQAIIYYNYSIQVNPQFSDAYLNLGYAYQQKGDEVKAQEYFAKGQQFKK